MTEFSTGIPQRRKTPVFSDFPEGFVCGMLRREPLAGGTPMKRREFAKRAAVAAAMAPAVWREVARQQEKPKPEPRLKLTPKQEEDVKKATDRREEQLAAMRSRILPYELEPAFVFAARPKARKKDRR
jgi:hypothetical protein